MKITLIFFLLFAFVIRLNAEPLEEMEYILRFGFIKGGKATLIAENEKINKKSAIHYRMRGRTTGLVDKIYEVNDIYESWVDPETYLPVKSVRNVKEQKYRFYDEVTYDHVNDSLFSQKSGRKKVPANVNDLVSVFFYIRQNQYFEDLLAGKSIKIPVYHGDDLFMMELAYIGIETIDTKIGRKECYVVSPKVPKGKLLKGSNELKIYITKDANRLPIYAEFELVLGALKCELNSYKINGVNQMVKE
ncbi:ATP-dependent exoDNAse alpha subunit - helicase superfamily I member [Aquipluma nitroreducens]|uniref:ATP-dependent exoDNAse alpha subunit - helicase superfamily I member n=1 Tax=Aquipluma nitroreducens TaxID=2010828 RepID=A0A5K7SA35_9BACT|nr:DUF3108 domain-containing protein [Aquipluma nitroreducens]BBE18329.1 ATP-dependent exoDNAse alpha subunit - helicase superfamily I member [Aquipluma nitroreducens]